MLRAEVEHLVIEGDFAALERRYNHFVAFVELFGFQLEAIKGLGPLCVVPCIGQQNTADVPENGSNG